MMDFEELPLGMGMGLAMNARAMEGYSQLSEAEKEDLILKCRDARSKDEMRSIIDSIGSGKRDSLTSSDDFPTDILGGPGIG